MYSRAHLLIEREYEKFKKDSPWVMFSLFLLAIELLSTALAMVHMWVIVKVLIQLSFSNISGTLIIILQKKR